MLVGGIHLVRESKRLSRNVRNNMHISLGYSFVWLQAVAVHHADGKERALLGILLPLYNLAGSEIAEFKEPPSHRPTKGRNCLGAGVFLGLLLVIRVSIKTRGKDIVGIRMIHKLGFETERVDDIVHDVGGSVRVGVLGRFPLSNAMCPRLLPIQAIVHDYFFAF
jgi:hypothetical protein